MCVDLSSRRSPKMSPLQHTVSQGKGPKLPPRGVHASLSHAHAQAIEHVPQHHEPRRLHLKERTSPYGILHQCWVADILRDVPDKTVTAFVLFAIYSMCPGSSFLAHE